MCTAVLWGKRETVSLMLLKSLEKTESNKEAYGSVNGMDFRNEEVLRNDKGKIIQKLHWRTKKEWEVGTAVTSSVESCDEENVILKS